MTKSFKAGASVKADKCLKGHILIRLPAPRTRVPDKLGHIARFSGNEEIKIKEIVSSSYNLKKWWAIFLPGTNSSELLGTGLPREARPGAQGG